MGCSISTPRAASASSAASADPDTAAATSAPRVPGARSRSHRNNSTQQQAPPAPRPLRHPRPYRNNQANPTHAPWTAAALARERRIFFETRVSGAPEIWQAVALAVELVRARDLPGAQGVLEAAGASVPRGRLEEGVWDERGVLYALPEWVLGDPVDLPEDGEDGDEVYGADDEDADDDVEKEAFDGSSSAADVGESIRIKARLSDRGTDVTVSVRRAQNVAALAKAVREAADIPSTTKIKFAYLGRVLKDNQSLSKQGWQPGHVVNALVFA